MLKVPPTNFVYHFPYVADAPYKGRGFGDRWAEVNFLLKTSERKRKHQLVTKNSWHKEFDEIASCLVSNGSFSYTNHPGNFYISHIHAWQSPYCNTSPKWTPNNSKIICYQLDGRYNAAKKNLNENETNQLFDLLHNLGYETINLGGMRPIKEIISIMSESKAFVGIPSGIAHVGCSVGIPEYIICKCDFEFHTNEVYVGKKNVTVIPNIDVLTTHINTC